MDIPVVIEYDMRADGVWYKARCRHPVPAEATGATKYEARRALEAVLAELSPGPFELIQLDATADPPWVAAAGWLPDDELIVLAVDEGFAFVTNNDADFRGLCAAAELHAGLVILPQGRRDDQRRWLAAVIIHIERRAAESGEPPADWMLNRVVEVDPTSDACSDAVLPDR